MNIQQIKQDLTAKTGVNFPHLSMVRQLDETTKEKQPWLSHWDNDNRIRVTMHEKIFDEIKANPSKSDLALKKEVVQPEGKEPYTRFVVITPTNIEATF